jgi:sugar transferase EpsL
VKRFFDLLFALLLLVLTLPLFIVVGLLVRARIGSPILFKQVRPGLKGKPFTLYKFRTMTDERDEEGRLLPDEVRLRPIGRLIRKLSLDELPQLWNVIKGDLSIVGPRPLLMEYIAHYSEEQARRHDVRPGITGWAQVNGRNNISWEKKFELDVWYVDHQSIWLDLKIILLTIVKVLKVEGVNKSGFTTTDMFTGTKKEL